MDLELKESGNGGDLVRVNRDLSVVDGFQNFIYLGLFGGNVRSSTPSRRIASEQAFDYWGNSLFFGEEPGLQFNSTTERVLTEVALNSTGRITIENAVKDDLKFMQDFADVTVEVSIPDRDKVLIDVKVRQLDNLQEKTFVFLWDSTKQELTGKAI